MGILDFLIGGGGQPGLLGGMFGQQPQKPQYDWQQPEAAPGFLSGLRNRKYEMAGYLSGALMPGSTQERIARGMQGMTQGAMTDIQSQMRLDALNAKRQQDAARSGVANDLPVSPALKRLFSQDEKIAQEAVKNMLYPQLMNVEGNILSPTMGGGARVIGSAPMSDKAEFANPDGTMSPGYTIRPNLSNPQGGMVQMGGLTGGAPPAQSAGNPAMPQMVGMPPNGARPPVTKLSPQQEKEGAGVGEGLAQDYTKIQKDAAAATRSLGTYQRLLQLNADPKLWQGAAAPAVTHAKSLLASFGIDPKSVAPGEEFTALANRAVLDSMNGSLGPGVSNNDVKFMSASLPALDQTVEGRKQLVETLSAVAKRQQQVAQMATSYRKATGSLDGFTSFVAQWAEANPLFAGRDMPASSTPAAASQFSRSDLEAEARRRGLLK